VLRGGEVVVGDESFHFAVIFTSIHYDHGVAFVGINDYGTRLFKFVSDLFQSLKFMVAILVAGWMLFIAFVIQFLRLCAAWCLTHSFSFIGSREM